MPLPARTRALARPLAWLAACAGLAALTELAPTAPSYDVWSWLGFGREILHGTLDTTGGTAWKPLPVAFTAPLSLTGALAPSLWVVVARAGGLAALLLAFRLARRLAGGGVAGAAAGLAAAAGIALTTFAYRDFALATSEGLLVAFVLLAVERHLDGHPRQALASGAVASLARPECWPLLAAYGLWVLWRDHRAWPLVAAVGVGVPALWFGPELWGSGALVNAAAHGGPAPGSYSGMPQPVALALGDFAQAVPAPLVAGVVPALVFALARTTPRRARIAIGVLAAGACVWAATVVAEMGLGASGSPRFFVAATAAVAVIGAVGWALLARAVADRLASRTRAGAPAWGAAAAAGAVVAGVLAGGPRVDAARTIAARITTLADSSASLPRAIAVSGGEARLRQCGEPATQKFAIPMVAWYLDLPVGGLTDVPARRGYVLQVDPDGSGTPQPRRPHRARLVAEHGRWRVFERHCPAPTRRLRSA